MLHQNTECKHKKLNLGVDVDEFDKVEQSNEAFNNNDRWAYLFGGD